MLENTTFNGASERSSWKTKKEQNYAPLTRLQVVDPLEVGDEKVARDDYGRIAEDIEEKLKQPHVLPVIQ